MRRFIHAADVHLGYRQYGSDERWNDFGRAFSRLVDETIGREADYLLLSGDLFHKNTLQPRTLLQATVNLGQLRDAGIGVIAIQGNHERPRYSDAFSWLDYLVQEELLILLDPQFQDGHIILDEWDPEELSGAFVDVPGGIRVVGARYCGASTPLLVHCLAWAFERWNADGQVRPAFTILMLHAGVEGMLPHYSGGLSISELESLRPYVDYLALGHIHKPFVLDDWVYNPGSLETCSIDEAAWPDRGYFLLDVEAGAEPPLTVTQVPTRKRGFVQFTWPVDAYEDPEGLYTDLNHCMADEAMNSSFRSPVVQLRLDGMLRFDRSALDIGLIERMLSNLFQAVVCRVRDLTETDGSEISVPESSSRAEVEQTVIRELVGHDARREPEADAWVATVLELKDMALRRTSAEDIIAQARPHGPS